MNNKSYTNLFNLALSLALKYHEGQTDRAGIAYILHPIAVSDACENIKDKIVGMLHDIVEDTDCTILMLKSLGFPCELTDAVDAISRREGESVDDYYARVIANEIATRVKKRDLEHNIKLTRLNTLTQKDMDRAVAYHRRLKLLTIIINEREDIHR